jgi:hypothetical protein
VLVADFKVSCNFLLLVQAAKKQEEVFNHLSKGKSGST